MRRKPLQLIYCGHVCPKIPFVFGKIAYYSEMDLHEKRNHSYSTANMSLKWQLGVHMSVSEQDYRSLDCARWEIAIPPQGATFISLKAAPADTPPESS